MHHRYLKGERKQLRSQNPFADLSFDDFRLMAGDPSLSPYERIGFPNNYREGFEVDIFADMRRKLPKLDMRNQRVLEIGPGCSELPYLLVEHCRVQGHTLTLVDSAEMLDHLPNDPFIDKRPGKFPACQEFIDQHRAQINIVVCYSVLHYAIKDTAFFQFFDAALALLAPGGQLLLGDIPNISKRKRFFASEAGILFHQAFMQTDEKPVVEFNRIEHDQIDDAIVLALLMRARSQGFDAYVLPQDARLPMANRREDLLIIRP
jgi:cyclopropane fatty-acyl-phospholipid synthase-like methyltransferase